MIMYLEYRYGIYKCDFFKSHDQIFNIQLWVIQVFTQLINKKNFVSLKSHIQNIYKYTIMHQNDVKHDINLQLNTRIALVS